MNKVYLTRRNLETLLKKLDDPTSYKTIIKKDMDHPEYPSTVETALIAVEDEDYYTDREPGVMNHE